MANIKIEEFNKKLYKKIGGDEKTFIKYLIGCCENILGKQIKGVGYPKVEKEYGLIPPILQLVKMNHELKVRLKMLKVE